MREFVVLKSEEYGTESAVCIDDISSVEPRKLMRGGYQCVITTLIGKRFIFNGTLDEYFEYL